MKQKQYPYVVVVKSCDGGNRKDKGIDRIPEPEHDRTCCVVEARCFMPSVRQKNIRSDYVTRVEGLDEGLVPENILVDLKKKLHCKGKIVRDKKLVKTIQLEGDYKEEVEDFLAREGLASP